VDAEGRPRREYVCRLLNRSTRAAEADRVSRNDDPTVEREPLLDFQAGYVLRALDKFPKQGSKEPWKLRQNYPRDLVELRFGKLEDKGMKFLDAAAPEQRFERDREALAA
jgi:hypothetical protein